MIERAAGSRRKWFLVASLVANIGVLAFFKYYNFFIDNVNFLGASLPYLKIILPIGLSFHTFQAMSYTIEVYRGNQKAERHFGIYALYVLFYPQLVAGPIERPQNILHQFHEKQDFNYHNAVWGLRLMLWGLFKKVVIADRLAQLTDPVFNSPGHYPGITIAIAAFFFAFQIFCDFSGYSDIAIGSARVMGFQLMTNFNRPYHARSISEFWKRWHISLSTWFKDYLYISLGGNRVSVPRAYFNLFFVFLVSGFWHGANWTFIIWGALHGLYCIFGVLTKDSRRKLSRRLGIERHYWLSNALNVGTTFILVAFAWIFFRANSVHDAFFITRKIGNVFSEIKQGIAAKNFGFLNLPVDMTVLLQSFGLIAFLELAHIIQAKYRLTETFSQRPALMRWGLYYAGIISILWLGVFEHRTFIYFQF
jgi:D-alanyl-lipoteichoic acid acyltransferase DltB (MBOAT superfamily)